MIPTFVVLCIVVANILPLISLCSKNKAEEGPAYLQDDYFDLPGERAAPQYPAAPRPKPAQPVNFKPAVANKFYPSRPAVVNQQIPPRPTTAPAVSKPAIPRPAFASQPVARPPQNLPKPAPLQPAPRPAFVPRAVAPKPAAVAPYTYPAQANVQPFVGPRPPFVNNQQFPNQWPYY